jgi:hypothetical protein
VSNANVNNISAISLLLVLLVEETVIVYHQTKSISSILMKTKNKFEGRRRRMVVGFTTTCTISVYRCEFEFHVYDIKIQKNNMKSTFSSKNPYIV